MGARGIKLFSDSYIGEEQLLNRTKQAFTKIALSEEYMEKHDIDPVQVEKNQMLSPQFLSREFKVSESTQTIGAAIAIFVAPLYQLWSQGTFQRITRMFTYFRFKHINFRFVLRSLPQQYGLLKLVKMPMVDETNTAIYYPSTEWVGLDPIVLSLNDQQAVTITLPYTYDRPWMPTNLDQESLENAWSVILRTPAGMTARISTDTSNTFQVLAYASFEGLELHGPKFWLDPSPGPSDVKKKKVVAQGQMDVRVEEARPEDWPDADLGVGRGAITSVPMATLAQGTAAAIAGMGVLSMPSLHSAWAAAKELFSANKMYKEVRGTFSQQQGVVESTHGDSAMLTDDGGGVTLDMVGDISLQDPKQYCDNELTHTIRSLISRPTLQREFVISAAAPDFTFNIEPSSWLYTPDQGIGFLPYFAQFFRRWRGSLKVMFIFTTSSFISARLVIGCTFGFPRPNTILDVWVGDIPSKVISVRGNETVKLEIPFVNPDPWVLTSPDAFYDGNVPEVFIHLESIGGSGDVTPSVICQYWICAGDDFVYDSYQLAQKSSVGATKLKAEGQMDVTAEMKGDFEPLPGFTKVKPNSWTLTVEELLFRWSRRGAGTAFVDSRVLVPAAYVSDIRENWDMLTILFLFNSGSIRRRLFTATSTGTMSVSLDVLDAASGKVESTSPCSPIAATDVTKWRVLDFSTPYVSRVNVYHNPCFYSYGNTDDFQVNLNAGVTLTDQWLKAGSNFQLMRLLPPPAKSYWKWSITSFMAPEAKNKRVTPKIEK